MGLRERAGCKDCLQLLPRSKAKQKDRLVAGCFRGPAEVVQRFGLVSGVEAEMEGFRVGYRRMSECTRVTSTFTLDGEGPHGGGRGYHLLTPGASKRQTGRSPNAQHKERRKRQNRPPNQNGDGATRLSRMWGLPTLHAPKQSEDLEGHTVQSNPLTKMVDGEAPGERGPAGLPLVQTCPNPAQIKAERERGREK